MKKKSELICDAKYEQVFKDYAKELEIDGLRGFAVRVSENLQFFVDEFYKVWIIGFKPDKKKLKKELKRVKKEMTKYIRHHIFHVVAIDSEVFDEFPDHMTFDHELLDCQRGRAADINLLMFKVEDD